MDPIVSISLVGVGGQGILLTSDILARTALAAGWEVKRSEVHGMSQRGGSVISQVRYGPKVHSPVIPEGGSDLLVAFERLEALRWRPLLKPDGRALVNVFDIVPITVSSGQHPGLPDLDARLGRLYPRLLRIEAQALAVEAGNARTANLVLAGALSTLLPFPDEEWRQAIRARLPAKLLDVNLRAFDAGVRAAAGTPPAAGCATRPR